MTKVASLLFAVTFLFTRIFYFGYGLYRSLMFWHAPAPEALAALGDRATAVQALQVWCRFRGLCSESTC